MATEQRVLQQKLTITPKTASLLLRIGYHDYRDLGYASTEKVMRQIKQLRVMPDKQTEGYRRAFRWIVWVATQEHPEQHVKDCKNWSQKGLKGRGIWTDGFDDLTGMEINKLILSKSALKASKTKMVKMDKSSSSDVIKHGE